MRKGKAMKIRETREETGFGGNRITWERVRTLAAGEDKPESAEQVPDDTLEHDWDLKVNRSARAPGG